MVADEPGDEPGIVAREPLFEAERLCVDGAELRVVAAAAFGDVVEQGGEVGDLGARQGLHDARQVRQLAVEAR